MRISIITVVYNGAEVISDCLRSVQDQTYDDVEHIVVDGGSCDGTQDILLRHRPRVSRIVSGPDKGLYHAMNKGLDLATGEVVGFLHSDDLYAHRHVLECVSGVLRDRSVNSCYGDLQYVRRKNPQQVIRYWRSSAYAPGRFSRGWMPPNPTFFVRKAAYERCGGFDTRFRIAADYELMLRFLEVHGMSTHYIQDVLVHMRTGGVSNRNPRTIIRKTLEDIRAWRVNGLPGGACAVLLKNVSKLPQFLLRPKPGPTRRLIRAT